jgi:hypothetical protein
MLFTINFDQARKIKQEEAAKDTALAEACAMTKTEAANLAWAKEGQISSPVCKGIIWVRLVFLLCLLMSTWLIWTPYFLEVYVYFYICFFWCIFYICCSWLPAA